MNYEEMNNHQINKRVARAIGVEWIAVAEDGLIVDGQSASIDFCNNPSDALPIIFENSISMLADSNYELERNLQKFKLKFTGRYIASAFPVMSDGFNNGEVQVVDKNPLRAAMICFLKMKDAENE